jgi:DNA-binding NarL/FixJ family response regulator
MAKRILVVDDHAHVRELIRSFMEAKLNLKFAAKLSTAWMPLQKPKY